MDCSNQPTTSDYIYVFTKKTLSDVKILALTEYLRDHYSDMVKIGDYYFDTYSFQHEMVLSRCLECEHYQEHNCCQGSPYPLVDEQQTKLLSIYKDIVDFLPDDPRRSVHHNIFDDKANYSDLFNSHDTIKSKDGCILAATIDNLPRCGLHYYCLEKGLNPLEYKPYICSLFPIFVIQAPSGEQYVFVHEKETSGFSLYFWTLGNRICNMKEKVEKVINQTEYKSKFYYTLNRDNIIDDNLLGAFKPAWVEQESVLKYFFGEDIYAKLVETMKNKEG